ncbi:DUF2726 domain-containing protein [uncultured Brachyspira sp.]|uniref:DUF2726 domain-containing protein n=1 Tax=uncultured Brachyspira sp. TaxID=221953 RepID=UPI0026140534|nr:DUF2726 domain-containing protein [uncultured Brachyspira sp.]
MFEISIIIVSIIIILIFIIFLISNKKKHKHETYSNNNSNNEYTTNEITEQRLKYMNSGSIKTKRVMNIEETKIFYSMVKVLNNYNVNPQVSFRAFLKGEEDTDSWKTFRDFYCDFLITYKRGSKMNEPIAVIEYHGGGHFGDTEQQREKVKNNDMIREKLFNKIGLKYFVIKDEDIKMKAGLIDEEKLISFLNDINIVLSK